jgi:hypothetical protein
LAPSHTQNNSEAVPCRWSSVTDSMPAVSTDQGRSAVGCSDRWRVRGDMVKGSPLHLRRFHERFSYPQGRSPGCRIAALSRLPRPAAQWHIGENSPVTVAGPRRILTGFPILPHRPGPCGGTPLGGDTLRRGAEASRELPVPPGRHPVGRNHAVIRPVSAT